MLRRENRNIVGIAPMVNSLMNIDKQLFFYHSWKDILLRVWEEYRLQRNKSAFNWTSESHNVYFTRTTITSMIYNTGVGIVGFCIQNASLEESTVLSKDQLKRNE